MEITDYLAKEYKAFGLQDTIESVILFLEETKFSHFPVIEEGVYIGSIGIENLENLDSNKKIADFRFLLEGFFTQPHCFWLEVLEGFSKNNCNLMPVLDENNNYLGYYEREEVMEFLYQTPFLKEQGKVIKIQKKASDCSISQVTQIIESNNGTILGLFVEDSEVDKLALTIKINGVATNEIIQAFRRYDYEISSEHQDDDYLNDLKEHSDYLKKYLSI